MHQTTIRFSTEIWHELEAAARKGGVSAAQFVRDATVARLAYAEGRRDAALPSEPGEAEGRGMLAWSSAREQVSESQAVYAQARQARARALAARKHSPELRGQD